MAKIVRFELSWSQPESILLGIQKLAFVDAVVRIGSNNERALGKPE
jgi:hypothetical protein